VQRTIDGVVRESISHEVDHIARFEAGVVALEIEWNNKDPFFDRDLENYKRLHADGAISLGILITRSASLQDQMRSIVLRFASEKGINNKADERIGLSPTRRQLAEYGRRHRGDTTFAQAWAAALMLLAPALVVVGTTLTSSFLRGQRNGFALIASGLAVASVIATAGFSAFPFLLPSSIEPNASLTIWDSSSSRLTLLFMLFATVVVMPIILAYTALFIACCAAG
jgi:Cytochrome bd terminal oxidase subunit II/Restriction endonuclease BglII